MAITMSVPSTYGGQEVEWRSIVDDVRTAITNHKGYIYIPKLAVN